MLGRSVRLAVLMSCFVSVAGCAAYRSDTRPAASASLPAYPLGTGPVVLWDTGHYNFARDADPKIFNALRSWISRDGYVVRTSGRRFDEAILSEADIVVIRKPLAAIKWDLPTPSAFSKSEIATLVTWVGAGGALLLVTEHMPFGGAVEELASAFGIRVINAFAVDSAPVGHLPWQTVDSASDFSFRRSDGSLPSHPVTNGRGAQERIDFMITNGGTAFELPSDAKSLLTLPASAIALLPRVTWEFPENTPRQLIGRWSQGGVMLFGRGRLAILGDAFSVWAPELIEAGTSGDRGKQHPQFTLNLFHWLAALLPGT